MNTWGARLARVGVASALALATVGGATAAEGTLDPTSTAATETSADPNGTTAIRTFAYHADGKLAGWVRRAGPRTWWASDGGNSMIWADRKGGYGITEGFHAYYYAWPHPRGSRTQYAVFEAFAAPEERLTSTRFVRISSSRWNILRSGRLTGFTKGPDGVAAALGFYMWGDGLLPN